MTTGRDETITNPWACFEQGESVELALDGVVHFSGAIDTKTADDEIIWLVNSGGERRLFHVHDGYVAVSREGQTR
jgi:hypothetical protein